MIEIGINHMKILVLKRKIRICYIFCRIPRSRKEITEYLGISTVFYAMQHYVQPLLESGELIMTIPNKPKSRNQKFVSVKKVSKR